VKLKKLIRLGAPMCSIFILLKRLAFSVCLFLAAASAAAGKASFSSEQMAIVRKCSAKADTLGLHGVERLNFRAQCKAVQADDYRIAETNFNWVPIDQRYEVQMLLGVAGFWPAVANDQFSHRLFEAIGRFQEANGFPASGILSSSQINRIREIADPILAYWQLRMIRHPAVGPPLWIPFGVGFNQIQTRSGIDFENSNKIASISFNFFPNGNLRSTYLRLLNVPGLRPVYAKIKDTFFVVDGESGGFNAYSRYQAIRSGIIGFTLSWTQDDAQNAVLHGERLATLMSDLFRANIELGLARSPPTPRPATVAVVPPPQAAPPPAMPATPEGKKPEKKKLFGTGFFVSSEGHIITNSHVVEDCSSVQVTLGLAPKMAGRIMTQDFANDLALIKVESHPAAFASFRSGVRLGEGVAAFGFPLAGLLATGGNFTLGNVTAVAGLGDDTRFLQISAPVQPGNSGGPLLDYSGNVVGVVEGKLNAVTVATITHDLPQNVNFAIKANVVTNSLKQTISPIAAARLVRPHFNRLNLRTARRR
jgi:serine protease Do